MTGFEAIANPLQKANALTFSHMGFYVRDRPRMARFYKQALGFMQTDQGELGPIQRVFLSRDPAEHRPLVRASGRPLESAAVHFNVINQISRRGPDLATLRYRRDAINAQEGSHGMLCATDGNAVSIYLRDPDGNRLEIFMDTPRHCEQPLREPIDLDQRDAAILARAEAIARNRLRFQAREGGQFRPNSSFPSHFFDLKAPS